MASFKNIFTRRELGMVAEKRGKRLGEILMEQGVLTEDNLKKALQIQKEESGLLGEILVKNNFVKEEDVVVALACQFNYPYLSVSNFIASSEAIQAVTSELARRYHFIPIDKVGNMLTLVMCDPSNEVAIETIQTETGCHVQSFVGTYTEIKEAIARYYRLNEDTEEPIADAGLDKVFKSARQEKSRETD